MPENATRPLTELSGIGPKLAERLAKLGIASVADLLFHLPLRYEDRTRLTPIGSVRPGARVLIEGTVEHNEVIFRRRRMLVAVLADGTGSITLRFFRFYDSQRKHLKRGTRLRCFGEVRPGYRGLEMAHPEYAQVSDSTPVAEALTPVYPTTEGLNQGSFRKLTDQALERLAENPDLVAELLPDGIRGTLDFTNLAEALQYVHRPPPDADVSALADGQHPAQKRLAFEELLAHNISLKRIRARVRARGAPALTSGDDLISRFIDALPFEPTDAQRRVIQELHDDLAQAIPTLRLVQGDVGSGKTVVAAAALLQAVGSGVQAAMTAPTEILAQQHLLTLSEWFEPLGIRVAWLSGRVKGKARQAALADIAGQADVVIGTHALFQDEVIYRDLGLVIVDEQHRFGVHQRLALRDKGAGQRRQPHQIVMTATPIPRTLAMTAYADLDVSAIDQMPPGRTPVTTVAVSQDRRSEVVERVSQACSEGRQAYWVCTLIEESEALEAETATDTARQLADALPDLRVGLVHGRLKPLPKEQVMGAFKAGELDLLVATTVIEVGVDVPNASLMIIDNAERLGLSQLHQLRGRVGRGSAQSSCVLLYKPPLTDTARERLKVMRESNDGFVIAQKDLELRGPGELLGTRQTGLVSFRIADLYRDRGLLDRVAGYAEPMLRDHPEMADALVQRWLGHSVQYADV